MYYMFITLLGYYCHDSIMLYSIMWLPYSFDVFFVCFCYVIVVFLYGLSFHYKGCKYFSMWCVLFWFYVYCGIRILFCMISSCVCVFFYYQSTGVWLCSMILTSFFPELVVCCSVQPLKHLRKLQVWGQSLEQKRNKNTCVSLPSQLRGTGDP